MNKLIKLGCIALAGTLLFSCETDPEKLEIVKPYPKSDQYYADLRDYKNSDHEIVFGWFGNWSATGASASNYMKSLPDSIDMVGLWGGWQTITEAQRKDMEDSQHKRGLKVIATSLFDGFEMGVAPDGATAATEEEMLAYWGWEGPYRSYGNDNLTEGNIAAIQRFAHAFCQRIIDNGYDGLDIDNEPNIGTGKKPYGISGFPNRYKVFMDVVVTYFGRTSGTGRILAIDGELNANMPREFGKCFDYFISQAYGCSGDSNLDGRLQSCANYFSEVPFKDVARKFREYHLPHQRWRQLQNPRRRVDEIGGRHGAVAADHRRRKGDERRLRNLSYGVRIPQSRTLQVPDRGDTDSESRPEVIV